MTETAEPRMTDRVKEVCAELMRGGRVGQYRSARSIADATGIPIGTVPSVIASLTYAGWLEVKTVGRSKNIRLTGQAYDRLRDLLREEQPITAPAQATRQAVKQVIGRVHRVEEYDGGRPWSMERLRQRDPNLARLIARKVEAGEYVDHR